MKTGNFDEIENKTILDLSPKLKKIKSEVKDIEGFGS